MESLPGYIKLLKKKEEEEEKKYTVVFENYKQPEFNTRSFKLKLKEALSLAARTSAEVEKKWTKENVDKDKVPFGGIYCDLFKEGLVIIMVYN